MNQKNLNKICVFPSSEPNSLSLPVRALETQTLFHIDKTSNEKSLKPKFFRYIEI